MDYFKVFENYLSMLKINVPPKWPLKGLSGPASVFTSGTWPSSGSIGGIGRGSGRGSGFLFSRRGRFLGAYRLFLIKAVV